VEVCCAVLDVSRSGYYAHLERPASARDQRRQKLAAKIKLVHEENRKVYGSPRVCQALRAAGESVCENTVATIMKERQIRAKSKKEVRAQDHRLTFPM
jgi:transposase InsO family protein